MKRLIAGCALLTLAGCGPTATSSTLSTALNTIQITVSAEPACQASGAQNIAARQAAVETIRLGYDLYMILESESENTVRVIGRTPPRTRTTVRNTTDGETTTQTKTVRRDAGGRPIIGGSYNQIIVVKMFHEGDLEAVNAISARETLGPNWQEQIEQTTLTCL